MVSRLVALWRRVPEPIRRLWGVVGWIEDHFSRATFIVAVVILVLTSGGVVTGYLSQAPPLALYIGGLAIFVLCIWAVAGVNLYLRTAPATALPTTPDEKPAPAEAPTEAEKASFKVLPILKKHVAGIDDARLRVENNGPEAHIGFSLEGVSDFQDDAIPFRMKWADPQQEGREDDFFSLTRRKPPVRTQKLLPIGGLESAVVAYAYEGKAKLYIPMPDDLRLEVPRPSSGEIELRIVTLANLPLADHIPAWTTYVIELSTRGQIKEFRVKKDKTPSEGS